MDLENKQDVMNKIISLAKRRGFIFPGSEIYGGLANSWDYGPLGTELKNNIKQEWWKRFVHQRPDVLGIDASLLMNPKVWEASGHIAGFSDPLVECRACHQRFRPDQIGGIPEKGGMWTLPPCPNPNCGLNEWTVSKQFNLMLKTFLGPAEEQANVVYFRPETAQAMFVDFKTILDTNRPKLPFGIAQIGKAFRNEITPGNFIFRTREFEQMEIEYFVKEKDWKQAFEQWLEEMKKWLAHLGVSEKNLAYVEIPESERAHYSKRTVDIEYKYPFGQKELYGLAYRGDFDLKNHFPKEAPYRDTESGESFWPHVIEPTWGVDRSVLVAMLEAYHEEAVPSVVLRSETSGSKTLTKEGDTDESSYAKATEDKTNMRVVLKFPSWLAPIKVAILPLSKKEELCRIAKEIFSDLSKKFHCEYDETQSIGKRYRRQDEIGTPLVVTVDFDSLKDRKVTLRDRDTMQQDRVFIGQLSGVIAQKLDK